MHLQLMSSLIPKLEELKLRHTFRDGPHSNRLMAPTRK
jgi:hypothetical protein